MKDKSYRLPFFFSLGLHGVMVSLLLPSLKKISEREPLTMTVEWEKVSQLSPQEKKPRSSVSYSCNKKTSEKILRVHPNEVRKARLSSRDVILGNTKPQINSMVSNNSFRDSRVSHFREDGKGHNVASKTQVSKKGEKVLSKKSYQPLPKYPWICRKRGQEGQVHLCIQTNEQGQVIKATLHKSSGYVLLDQTALEAVTLWTFMEGSKQKLLSISFRLKG